MDEWVQSFFTGADFLSKLFKGNASMERALQSLKAAEEKGKSKHGRDGATSLAVLRGLHDAQLRQIYSEYNWGLDAGHPILAGAVGVLAGDVRKLAGLPVQADARISDMGAGESISYKQFLELITALDE